MQNGWDTEYRTYSDRVEAWVKFNGNTVMILNGEKGYEKLLQERVARLIEREDASDEQVEVLIDKEAERRYSFVGPFAYSLACVQCRHEVPHTQEQHDALRGAN